MEVTEIITAFSSLGPALGAVVAIGFIAYFTITGILSILNKVLIMFSEHGNAIKTISDNMKANTEVMSEVHNNMKLNTMVTESVYSLLKTHITKL